MSEMYGITPFLKILHNDLKSEMANMIKEWVVLSKLEDFNSLLKYTDDDFTPTGNLCYTNENGETLHQTNMQELNIIRWYIQNLIDENEYQYDDDEWTNPLSESNWIYQTNKYFMKYEIFSLKRMTPEQLKQNPMTVHHNQKLDTDEGECNSTKMKRNSPHLKNCQKKILHLTYLLRIQMSQNLQKHLKFLLYSTKQYIMKMIHLKTNL